MTKGAFRVELQGFIGDRHIDRFGKGTWEVGPPRSSRKGGTYNAWPIDGGEMLLARDLDELHDYIESVYLGPLTSDVTDNITDDELLGGVFECEGRSFTVRADDLVCIWHGWREEPQFMIFRPRGGATTGGAVPAIVKPEKRPSIGPLPPPKRPK